MTFKEECVVFAVCVLCVLAVFGAAWGVFTLLKTFTLAILIPGVS